MAELRAPRGHGSALVGLLACLLGVDTDENDVPPIPDVAGIGIPAWEGQVVQPQAIFVCGPQPKGVAIHPNGKEVWVTMLGGPPSLVVYELPTGRELASLSLGKTGAVEVIFNDAGTRAYVSQMESALVYEIDAGSRTLVRTLDTDSVYTKWMTLSPDEKTLWASNWHQSDISEFDLESGALRRKIPSVKTPRGMFATSDGRHLVVTGYGNGEMQRIDLATGEGTTFWSGGFAARHIVAHEASGRAFMSDMGTRSVYVIDLKTWGVERLARTDPNPNSIDVDDAGTLLYVSNRGANGTGGYLHDGPNWGSVLVIDAETGAVLDSIVGGDQCTGLDASPDGRTLVFSDFRDHTCRVYAVPTREALRARGWPRREVHQRDLVKATSRPGPVVVAGTP